jgi:LmbE family N-acetylglucosaminyl deacetylase
MAAHTHTHTLVLSPHIDDESLGCGGILNNRRTRGTPAFVYWFGVEEFHVVSRAERLREAAAVAERLGFGYEVGPWRPNRYDVRDLIDPLQELLNRLRPREVFIPNRAFNLDHTAVHEAALVALRPHDRNHFVPRVFVYDPDQYRTWAPSPLEANYFEQIEVEAKVAAYLLHKSQVRAMRPPELIRHFACVHGVSAGVPHAEAFQLLRMTNLYEGEAGSGREEEHL